MKAPVLLSLPLLAAALPFSPSAFCASRFDVLNVCENSASADPPATLSAVATTTAAAAAAGAADLFQQLTAAITTLQSQLVSTNDTLNTFKPYSPVGIFTALQIQSKIGDVGDTLTQATQLADTSAPFNDEESSTLAQQFLALEPQLFSLLNNIVVHKPSFATAAFFVGDITKTVEATLVEQRQLSSSFATAVGNKLTPLFGGAAPIIAQQIDQAFVTTINAFQQCSGLVCLPAISF